ncbi:MAG: DUF2207 domain-containing protein [Muribaculaceae bacterium]|nr:DUF2207 domain-containing protein [Muribaculaceae bacterium]
MILIILAAFLILPFVLVSLGMTPWLAITSWLLLIVVSFAASVWYYGYTEEGREKMAEWNRAAARMRRRVMKESVLAEDDESADYDYDLYPDTPDADDTSTVGYYDYDSDYGDGDDCSDGYGSDSSYGSDCGDGGGMC